MDLGEYATDTFQQALTQQHALSDMCIHHLFERQVERTPQALALCLGETSLTYQQLNSLANQLAHYLRTLDVGPEVFVGICLDRSLEMVVAILGILKAGGAFIPLDPTYPQERLAFILHDTQLPLLITQQALVERFSAYACRKVCLDSDQAVIAQGKTHNPVGGGDPENLAYVIYTSGSTGQPKGVLVPQRGVVNHCLAIAARYQLQPEDRVLQFASLHFDVAFEEIFPSWLCGAAVIMRSAGDMLELLDFLAWVEQEHLTVLNLPTAYWHAWVVELPHMPALSLPSTLRLLIVGGEQMLSEHLQLWRQKLGDTLLLYNAYGPTETTITATLQELPAFYQADLTSLAIPIGKPIAHMQAYILDEHWQQAPPGVEGELYIAGAGLARGYLDHPDLTAERFLPHPFTTEPGARLYRTGDLARFLPDRAIEFLGRVDQQIKIRGYRIELGEIESALRRHPLVRDAVVLAREEHAGEKQLAAYLLPSQPGQHSELANFRSFLSEQLPAYMIPVFFTWLEAFPLTAGGKLDRRALPAPRLHQPMLSEQPRTPVQEILTNIWTEVLGIAQIELDEHFFDLGGNSLAAIRIVSRIRAALRKELPLPVFFRAPTILEQAELLDAIDAEQAGQGLPAIRRASREEPLPLSFAQESVWFIQQLAPDNGAYCAPAVLRITGLLDISSLERGINELSRRHEVLRTTFSAIQGKPVQIIHEFQWTDLPVIDLQGLPLADREQETQRIIQEEIRRPFTVTQLPLIRWTLLRLAPEEAALVLAEHHFIHDGWSTNMLLGELTTLYTALVANERPLLPELHVQFADFASWQQQWIEGEEARRQMDYWTRQLSGSPPLLELPTDWPRPSAQRFHGSSYRMQVSSAQYAALKACCQQEEITLFMLLLTLFFVLLQRYSGQDDLCVGSGMANRRRHELENVAGMVINAVALRADLSGNPSFRELFQRVRDITLGAYAHQEFPFEKIVEALHIERNLSYNPIFQVMFGIHDAPLEKLALPSVHIDLLEAPSNGSAKFDLNIIVIPRPEREKGWDSASSEDGITMIWEYNTDLFHATTIEQMMGHYQTLLTNVLADPAQRLAEVSLLSPAELEQVLVAWNATHTTYPADQYIHQLFEMQARQKPSAIALIYGEQQLTYHELNQRANQLAHALQRLGIGPETLVGVCMERSAEMVVALLAILKAGGAYVPLDPAYPAERLHYIVQDANMRLILVHQSARQHLENQHAQVRMICWEELCPHLEQEPSHNLLNHVSAQNLAYVIYTSGSTGKPKGVAIQHQSAVTLFHWAAQIVTDEELAGIVASTSICFDLSIFEVFMPLARGGTVILVEDALHIPELMGQTSAVLINTVPSAIKALLEMGNIPASVRKICLAGEALSGSLVQALYQKTGAEQIYNLYGPSEDTTYSTYALLSPDTQSPPIGRPIANTRTYILDQHLYPVPPGLVGELYIAGAGLARGYMQKPDATAEVFLPNPWGEEPGERLYKTGDLVRYREEGTIEFLGRADQQVKLRGYRIEPGEIEYTLKQCPGVRDCLAMLREDMSGDKRLVAYIVPDAEQTLAPDALRSFVQKHLPEYMTPAHFVLLERLPFTPNGKVDRRALRAPEREQAGAKESFVPPRNTIEEKLVDIWFEVLGSHKIGIHDNFFALGGHSLLAAQIIARINNMFAVELPLRTLFEQPTIAGLAVTVVQYQARQIDSDLLATFLSKLDQSSERNGA